MFSPRVWQEHNLRNIWIAAILALADLLVFFGAGVLRGLDEHLTRRNWWGLLSMAGVVWAIVFACLLAIFGVLFALSRLPRPLAYLGLGSGLATIWWGLRPMIPAFSDDTWQLGHVWEVRLVLFHAGLCLALLGLIGGLILGHALAWFGVCRDWR